MGLNVGLNALTSGGLFLSTVLLVVMGILLVTASNKVKDLDDFDDNDLLKRVDSNFRTAYILAFIAAGFSIILGIAYAGHEVAWCPSEWLHGGVYLLLYAAVIISIIYAYLGLNDVYSQDIPDRNGSDAFTWAALLVGVIAFLTITATGSGRVGYNASRSDITNRVRKAERKIHEAHSAVTGQPLDYEEPKDMCAPPPCSPAPAPPMYVQTPQTQQRVQTGPIQLPQAARPLGPPITTSHTVTTTTQPMISPRV